MINTLSKFSSLLVLLTVNLIPLYGVLYQGWETSTLLILYWVENIIIGFYNIFKLLRIERYNKEHKILDIHSMSPFPSVLFFIMHYGIFTVVHGVFILTITGMSLINLIQDADAVLKILSTIILPVLVTSVFLFISHGHSYLVNYLGRKEYINKKIFTQMMQPYSRVVIVHMAILLGFGVSIAGNSSIIPVVILIALKTSVDAIMHLREHHWLR